MTNQRLYDLNRFYEVLTDLRLRVGGARMLQSCNGRMDWPKQGIYFFFEPGEFRGNLPDMRVTRVGTHAVSAGSKTTLWDRLAQHQGTFTGKYAGGGNHRGSVFRRHVGVAMLNCNSYPSDIHLTWAKKKSHSGETRLAELPLERDVSDHIRSMPFLWLRAEDGAGTNSIRALIERNSIGILSNAGRLAIDPPSIGWLGNHSPHPDIRASGLWNVSHVTDQYDPAFLNLFEQLVSHM